MNNAILTYATTGAANADTTQSAASGDPLASHPATPVQFLVSYPSPGGPVWTALPASTVSPGSATFSTSTLPDGAHARIVVPTSGLGLVRVEWVAGGDYFQLISVHRQTDDGVSGVDAATLLGMAGSVRPS